MFHGGLKWKRALRGALAFAMIPAASLVAMGAQPAAAAGPTLFSESFETFAVNDDPTGFLDTAPNNSMAENDALFAVSSVDSAQVLTTTSSASNIHSHIVDPVAQAFAGESGYVFTGAMRVDSAASGIGVTFFSDYPNSDSYYRLRRYSNGGSFHLSPHGTSITSGVTDSGVVPVAGQWYRFEIEVADEGSETTIKAKVWADGAAVPTDWQIDATDSSASRLTTGTVGVWSYLGGARHWDDFTVAEIGQPAPHSIVLDTVGSGTAAMSPDIALHPHGSSLQITATPDAGHIFVGWTGAVTTTDNPATVVADADKTITANFVEDVPVALTTAVTGNGSVSVSPDQANYPVGTSVDLTAAPDPGWDFIGWSGDLSGSENPATLVLSADANVTAVFAETPDALLDEDFEAAALGSDPANWLDTAANNSMVEDNGLFDVVAVDGTQAFGTSSTASNIHSHYSGPGATGASNYEYSGRMRVTNASSGIGVTVLSDYANSDTYYRIRRYGNGGDFHLSPHGATMTSGTTSSGVVPTVNTWYRFRVQVEDIGTQTDVRARIWAEGSAEPANWQIDAADASSDRLTTGTVGVWSHGSGAKAWDDLLVGEPAPVVRYTLTTNVSGNGAVSADPASADYAAGEVVTLTASADPGWQFTAWSGAVTGTTNPTTTTLLGDQAVTATFTQIPVYTLDTTVVGNGTLTVAPDQATYEAGTEVAVTAVPDVGWLFDGWSGALTGTTNPTSVVVDSNTSITATFVEASAVTLTLDTVGQGTATPSPDQPTYFTGDTVTLTADPDPGWNFVRWDSDPVVADNWWNPQWSYRLPINVDAAGTDRNDLLADIGVDFTAAWSALGVSATFDPDSLRVVEIDGLGAVVDADVPFQFDPSSTYDPNSAAVGTMSIFVGGSTAAGASRSFHAYFDNVTKNIAAATVAPLVTLTDGVADEGLDTVRVETGVGTYFYDKDGGGFSSIVDVDGNDWINHNATFGSAGSYRGVPNLVYPENLLHPGEPGVTTTIVNQGPLKVTLRSLTADGAWETLWEIGPSSAQMTVLAADHDYWFLYEGTPGGSLDLATDVVVRSDGTETTAGQSWTGDLTGEEWVYFGDPNVGTGGRSLYLVNHDQDTATDSYYPLDGNMTVFGFGRSGTSRFLDLVPSTFTLGLTDGVANPAVSSVLRSEYVDLVTSVGAAESALGVASTPTLTFDITTNQVVTAVFEEIQPITLDLTTSGSGSVVVVPAQASYLPGDVVTITASAASGSYFSGWSGDQGGTTNPLDVTLTNNTAIVANFAQDGLLVIDTNTTGNGSIQLSPDQPTYNFGQEVTATAVPGNGSVFTAWTGDLSGNTNPQTITVDGSNSISATFDLVDANAPVIDVWYGDTQNFGQNGRPQRWRNVVGNVSDPDGITSLTYRLNGGPSTYLSVGPDTRRLARSGDFNVDLDDQSLVDGLNTVVITAVDDDGDTSNRTVIVDYESGNVWPSDYDIDWSTESNVLDVAQPVDGEWILEGDGVRSIDPAYDRLLAIGDVAWTDYEVSFPVTVNAVDNTGFGTGTSGLGAGLGVLMRWNGHTDVPVVFPQPKTGYLPYGAIGWYWWTDPNTARLQIDGNNQVILDSSSSSTPPSIGVEYMIKMRVTTQPGVGGLYELKSWPSSQAEPAGWQVAGQESLSDPQSGSLMLVAHHIDATFGDVEITPLGQTTGSITTDTVGNGSVVIDPIKTEYAFGEQVTVTAVPDAGWEFTGWQGDLTGTSNPDTINLTGDMQVTATFVDQSAPPVISDISVETFTTSAVVSWTTDRLSSSTVSYGPTAAYGTDESDPALVTAHSVTLSGLDPLTTYHYSVTSADGASNSASSDDATFVTLDANNPSGLISDDFNVCSIDANVWTLINPVGDGTASVDGTVLELAVPGGVAHDVWTGGNNSVRLMQDVNDTDFEFEVKFDSTVTASHQLQGLIVEQDASNYLRFDFYGSDGNTYLFAARFVNGTPTVVANVLVAAGTASTYMRVSRSGDTWVQQWSTDGASWATNTSFDLALNIDAVGIFAGNAGGNAPAHTALVDYGFVTSSPIVPEDGTTQNCGGGGDTTPPVVSGIQTNTSASAATISWTTDEASTSSVSFGATAAYGNVVSDPALVTNHSVTLTGLDAATTYHFSITSADGSGNSTSTADATFTTSSAGPSPLVSDDFNACSVNAGLWTIVDPVGDGSVSVDGTNLNLSVPAGIAHDVWTDGNNGLRLSQDVDDDDFEYEVKFDSTVTDAYQVQGVVIVQDADNFMRFDFYGNDGRTYLFAAHFVNGVPTVAANVRVYPGSGSTYMRVARTGDSWVQTWSTNGTDWATNAAFSHALNVDEVGVYAGNAGGNAPAHTAVIDYAFDTSSPIVPEDFDTLTC